MNHDQTAGEVVLTEVYNLDEAQLISGLLIMAGIPVKLGHETAGELFGLSVGPLAMIKIIVPAAQLADAQKILAGEITGFEEDGGAPDEL